MLRISKVFMDFEKEGVFVGELRQFVILQKTEKPPRNFLAPFLESNSSLKKIVISMQGIDESEEQQIISFLKFLIENNYFISLSISSSKFHENLIKYADFVSLNAIPPSSRKIPYRQQFDIISKYVLSHPQVEVRCRIKKEHDASYVVGLYSLIHDKHPYTPLSVAIDWKNASAPKKLLQYLKEQLMEESMDYVKVILVR